jgi:hypothetical protein
MTVVAALGVVWYAADRPLLYERLNWHKNPVDTADFLFQIVAGQLPGMSEHSRLPSFRGSWYQMRYEGESGIFRCI